MSNAFKKNIISISLFLGMTLGISSVYASSRHTLQSSISRSECNALKCVNSQQAQKCLRKDFLNAFAKLGLKNPSERRISSFEGDQQDVDKDNLSLSEITLQDLAQKYPEAIQHPNCLKVFCHSGCTELACSKDTGLVEICKSMCTNTKIEKCLKAAKKTYRKTLERNNKISQKKKNFTGSSSFQDPNLSLEEIYFPSSSDSEEENESKQFLK